MDHAHRHVWRGINDYCNNLSFGLFLQFRFQFAWGNDLPVYKNLAVLVYKNLNFFGGLLHLRRSGIFFGRVTTS